MNARRRGSSLRRSTARLAALASLASLSLSLAAAVSACAKDEAAPVAAPEAGVGAGGDAGRDGSSASEDAAMPATDSGDSGVTIIDGPGEAGAECSFNRDCNAVLRCECSETQGCACKAGTRGTGKNGIDPCNDGNACASAVCVEGPPDSGSFCSDECATSANCTGQLPLCATITFVGRICIRKPP